MPMSQDEMASEYRAELESVVNNNKAQINLLTILAEDYAQASKEIVEAAEPPVKILILYVIDSIVKNLPKVADYRDLFSKSIVKIFTHVFTESEPAKRAALYKLRLTWNDILPRNRLYAIDTKINAIDKNWPIASLTAALASTRPPPDAAAPTSSSKENFKQEPARTANPTTSAANQMVHVNPKFLNKNEAARMSGNSSDSGSSSSMSTARRQPVVSIGGVEVADKGGKRLSAADSSENSSSGGPLKSALKKPNTPADPISKLTK
uniref:CID domain-containing protein n=1 Tax=Ditylenchus dipsaci TaxID=166011 RepID=A0A915D024_9BILA